MEENGPAGTVEADEAAETDETAETERPEGTHGPACAPKNEWFKDSAA